ncbi:ribonuclease III [Pelistega indica]|uniref:Ribonuclease 3 n=1 Tax=Pelistega indica TaxID=1414851 RepID=V8G9V7_9BURK|nr:MULTISPECIES: ribonuclease III [Pelistega]ETD72901.1 ribonuclease III [Pelistega indica]
MKYQRLQERLSYKFTNMNLLMRALTHRSYSMQHNERLEFLGDSILNFSVASLLFTLLQHQDEGDLSRIRSSLVNQSTLAELAIQLELPDLLLLGEGELKSGGFRRPSILADAMEAIFGAIYLDNGIEQAQQVIEKLYRPLLKDVDFSTLGKDAKTLLQEMLQARRLPLPQYTVLATTGAAHDQQFEVECSVPDLNLSASATGGSRRAAEQSAAKIVINQLKQVSPNKKSIVKAKQRVVTQLTLPVAVEQEIK